MAVLSDVQRGRTTGYNNCVEGYSTSLYIRVPRKRLRGKDASASLLLRQVNIEAQPMIKLLVDGQRCIALVDSRCSKMVMCKSACHSWRPREAKVVNANGKTLTSLGVGTVVVKINNICPLTMEVLLGLDLLLGVNVIAKLGGVHISSSGELSFAAENVPESLYCNKRT